MTAVNDLVRPDRYPRSAAYDPAWLLDLDMGPNPLWLLEDLARDLDPRPGARVLDLGSGMGATSVFLAREYGVRVVAADWWVGAERAAAVFAAAGVGDRVEAVHAEAHALPFADESFDAIVSIDAFEYFGTADGYLPYLLRFLRPGGQLAVATPAMTREVREMGAIPPHVKAVVGWEAIAWHTPAWCGSSGRSPNSSRSPPRGSRRTAGGTGCCGRAPARRRTRRSGRRTSGSSTCSPRTRARTSASHC
ncbi:methyltransferase domain-containing protein [Streptomyces buecherae]|uniref:methyltransferase domain-containing protein n=1 Tax=Streptomyces buecherae TaxID=2763006 RepID=UPI0036478D71